MTTYTDIASSQEPRWMTATDISRIYQVGTLRLHEYSMRGDLPCVESRHGELLFDVSMAEGLFRRRRSELVLPEGAKFGDLGKMSLGPDNSRRPRLQSRVRSIHSGAERAA